MEKQQLIPGGLYLTDKGEEIIFLGIGQYSRIDSDGSIGWQTDENMYLYMKKLDIEKKISSGKLTPDFRVYNSLHNSKSDFWRTVFFSAKPRKVVQFLGYMYPADLFKDLTITDMTNSKYGIYHWIIKTI